jgi:hypothetical protein
MAAELQLVAVSMSKKKAMRLFTGNGLLCHCSIGQRF